MSKYFAVAKKTKRDCTGIIARAIISSNSRDLAGTIVKQDGISFPERVSLLSSHDDHEVIGFATNFSIEGDKTYADVAVLNIEYASLVRNKALLGISVGLDVLEGEDTPGGTISKSTLLELSLTPVPANQDAMILYDTIRPFCSVEESGGKMKATVNPDKASTRTVSNRLTRQVKHYRSAVRAKLAKLKKITK